jgi:hypothetical protein
VPPPEFHASKLCDAVFAPWTHDGVRVAGLSEIVGGGFTVSVTATVCGLFVAAASVTVIVAVCVPAARPDVVNVTVIVSCSPVDVPDVGLQESHVAVSVIAYESVPPPEFHTSNVCEAAFAPATHDGARVA